MNRDDFEGRDSELTDLEEDYLAAVEQAQHISRVYKMLREAKQLGYELIDFYEQVRQGCCSPTNRNNQGKLLKTLHGFIRHCDTILAEFPVDEEEKEDPNFTPPRKLVEFLQHHTDSNSPASVDADDENILDCSPCTDLLSRDDVKKLREL